MARPKVKVDSETVARAEEALGKIKESKLESPAETLFGGFIYSGHQAMLFDKLGG